MLVDAARERDRRLARGAGVAADVLQRCHDLGPAMSASWMRESRSDTTRSTPPTSIGSGATAAQADINAAVPTIG